MPQVVLIGREWNPRALLRAELLEQGIDVEAYESVEDAREAIENVYPLPRLVIADLAPGDDLRFEIGRLAEWSRQVLVWVIASHVAVNERELQERGFQAIFFRPVDIGRLVAEIKRAVASN